MTRAQAKMRRAARVDEYLLKCSKKGVYKGGLRCYSKRARDPRVKEEGAIGMQRMSHAVEYFTFYGFAYYYGKASLGLTAQGAAAGDRS